MKIVKKKTLWLVFLNFRLPNQDLVMGSVICFVHLNLNSLFVYVFCCKKSISFHMKNLINLNASSFSKRSASSLFNSTEKQKKQNLNKKNTKLWTKWVALNWNAVKIHFNNNENLLVRSFQGEQSEFKWVN